MNRNAIEKLRLKEKEAGPEADAYWQGVVHGNNDTIDAVLALEPVIPPTVGDEEMKRVSKALEQCLCHLRIHKMIKDGEGTLMFLPPPSEPSGDARKALDALEELKGRYEELYSMHFSDVENSIGMENIETIRLALTQPPKIEGLDEAIKDWEKYSGPRKRLDLILEAARQRQAQTEGNE